MKISVCIRVVPAAVVVLSLLAPVALAQQPGQMDMRAMMEQSHQKMTQMPNTGQPDVDFAMMMREHHMSAVRMAEWEVKNGKDQQMKKMAQKIITDQKKEIGQFDQFLAKHGHKPGAAMERPASK